MSASASSLRPAPKKKTNAVKKGVGIPLRSNHAHIIPTGLKRGQAKSNAAVNQSTSLNRTTDTINDQESERGSLKYVSANLDNKLLKKQQYFS